MARAVKLRLMPTKAASSSSTLSWITRRNQSSTLGVRCSCARNAARAANSAGISSEAGAVLWTRTGASQQLIAVTVRFVAPYLKVSEEALNRLSERHMMGGQLVALEVILKIGGREAFPVDHSRSSILTENDRSSFCGAIISQFGVKIRADRWL